MRRTSIAVQALTVLLLLLVFGSEAPAAERMTVIAYYNMTKGAEAQIKLVDGKWKAFVRNEPVDMAVVDIENGYLEFEDPGTGGGGEQVSAALFLTKDKAPMLAELRIPNSTGQCPDTVYALKTYTLRGGRLAETKDVLPAVPFDLFLKQGYDLKKSAPHVVPDREYRVGYRLPRKGTTVEAFLDVSTASCELEVFGEQMSAAVRDAHREFLQNVSKEPAKLKWNKAVGRFDPLSASGSAPAARSALPTYTDYPAKEQFSGKPAAPDLKSDPDAKRLATVLTEGAKNGPDFAGHYTVVLWGCGTGCQSFVIVDAKSGAIHSPKISTERGLCYRKDSSLLIMDPITKDFVGDGEEVPAQYSTKYFSWDGKKLNPVGESRTVIQDENCK